MRSKWIHLRGLKGTCPSCGRPIHVGVRANRNNCYFWLHDSYSDYLLCGMEGDGNFDQGIDKTQFFAMVDEAEKNGKQLIITSGSCKPVRCVETGETYPSLKDAGKSIGRRGEGIGAAIRRNGTCGGYHWEYVQVDLGKEGTRNKDDMPAEINFSDAQPNPFVDSGAAGKRRMS